MNVTDSAVRDLHFVLLQIADIKSQLERGPRQIKAAQLQLDAAKDAVQKCRDSIKAKKMEADRKQLQLREREAKIRDWEGKMNAAKNNREFQAIKEQIAADMQANSVQSDEILEALEEVDALNANLKDLESKQKTAESDKAKMDAMIAERLAVLRQDLERCEGNLAGLESKLPADFHETFRRMVDARQEDALAPIDDVSCGGCNKSLPPKVLDRLRMGQPIPCPSCGRILYRPE